MPQTSEILNPTTQSQKVHNNNPSKLLIGEIKVSKEETLFIGTPDDAIKAWKDLKGTRTVDWKLVQNGASLEHTTKEALKGGE